MSGIKECPQCGAPLDSGVSKCGYCKSSIFVSTVSYLSNYDNSQIQKYIKSYKELIAENPKDDRGYLGLGICYLQLSMFPLARENLEQAIKLSPENASVYYYYCLSVIAGQRLRSMSVGVIEELVAYLNTAIEMEPNNPLYLLLLMLINHDFYIGNHLRQVRPTFEELVDMLDDAYIDDDELTRLKSCVRVADYSEFGL